MIILFYYLTNHKNHNSATLCLVGLVETV